MNAPEFIRISHTPLDWNIITHMHAFYQRLFDEPSSLKLFQAGVGPLKENL